MAVTAGTRNRRDVVLLALTSVTLAAIAAQFALAIAGAVEAGQP